MELLGLGLWSFLCSLIDMCDSSDSCVALTRLDQLSGLEVNVH